MMVIDLQGDSGAAMDGEEVHGGAQISRPGWWRKGSAAAVSWIWLQGAAARECGTNKEGVRPMEGGSACGMRQGKRIGLEDNPANGRRLMCSCRIWPVGKVGLDCCWRIGALLLPQMERVRQPSRGGCCWDWE